MFSDEIAKYSFSELEVLFESVKDEDVQRALKNANNECCSEFDLIALLSDKADKYLEEMATISQRLTRKYFGRTISLYLPIYVANYCCNSCVYCGYSATNKIKRKQMTLEEVEAEAKVIAKTEIRHILLLTGESAKYSDFEYIKECVKIIKKYFDSVSIEVYPLTTEQYKELKDLGVDGLTIYQETYNSDIYKDLHPSGPKRDYTYRLNTPDRGAIAGLRWVSIGALLGLANAQIDAFFGALHCKYLMDTYLETEFSLSVPRIKDAPDTFEITETVSDFMVVKFLTAFRLFLPRAGISMSTRETSDFRDNVMSLGVTKMSAGSKTDVGGYSLEDKSDKQFDISDERSVEEVVYSIKEHNMQAVFKDWWRPYE